MHTYVHTHTVHAQSRQHLPTHLQSQDLFLCALDQHIEEKVRPVILLPPLLHKEEIHQRVRLLRACVCVFVFLCACEAYFMCFRTL